MDCSLQGSSVHGILQPRILEWVTIPFSRGSSQPKDWTQVCCIADGFFTVLATSSSCSVAKSCLAICDPMECSMPSFPVLHYLLEFAQFHVHWVSDAIQPSHPLSPTSHQALSLSQQWTLGCSCPSEPWFSLNIGPGLWLLDHMVALFLVFQELPGLPCCPVVKNLPVNAGDTYLIPALGRFRMWQSG